MFEKGLSVGVCGGSCELNDHIATRSHWRCCWQNSYRLSFQHAAAELGTNWLIKALVRQTNDQNRSPATPPPPPPLTAHTPGSINCCISCITTWVVFAGHTCVTWKGSYRHVLYGFLSRVAWFKWFTSDVKITSRWFSIESPYGVGRWVLVLVLEMNLESWIKRELPQIAFMVIYYKGNLCFSH